MNGMVKKYLPYAVTIFAVYLIAPLLFRNQAMQNLSIAFCLYFREQLLQAPQFTAQNTVLTFCLLWCADCVHSEYAHLLRRIQSSQHYSSCSLSCRRYFRTFLGDVHSATRGAKKRLRKRLRLRL